MEGHPGTIFGAKSARAEFLATVVLTGSDMVLTSKTLDECD